MLGVAVDCLTGLKSWLDGDLCLQPPEDNVDVSQGGRYLYVRGQPTDFVSLVLDGNVEVNTTLLRCFQARLLRAWDPHRFAGCSGAQVTAGSVTLTNTTARAPGVLPGGTGQLSVNATTAEGGSGELRLGAGHVAVAGAAQLNLSADRGISLVGTGQLVASNQVTMQAPAITAAEAAARVAR